MIRAVVAAVLLLMIVQPSEAGGSSEIVSVKSLSTFNETEFVLVVAPRSREGGYVDPYMGRCQIFTVLGRYDKRRRRFTEEAHLAALALLAKAKRDDAPIRLGWMGTGFVRIDEDEPCVVRSRGLEVFTDDNGDQHVISYHD